LIVDRHHLNLQTIHGVDLTLDMPASLDVRFAPDCVGQFTATASID
jgi:hypothetical protein